MCENKGERQQQQPRETIPLTNFIYQRRNQNLRVCASEIVNFAASPLEHPLLLVLHCFSCTVPLSPEKKRSRSCTSSSVCLSRSRHHTDHSAAEQHTGSSTTHKRSTGEQRRHSHRKSRSFYGGGHWLRNENGPVSSCAVSVSCFSRCLVCEEGREPGGTAQILAFFSRPGVR